MSNEHFLSELREAVKTFTEADPYFAEIEILNERLKDLDAKLDEKLAQLGGISIVLVTPVVGGVLTNVTGANFTDIVIAARVLENVLLNETGKEALDVAIYLAALWSQAKPDTFCSALRPGEPVISLGNDPKYLSYDVSFLVEGGTKIEIPRLAAPVATEAEVDLSTASVRISGSFGAGPDVDGIYTPRSSSGGKTFYNLEGEPNSFDTSAIIWNPDWSGGIWLIYDATTDIQYTSNDNVFYPWEVTTWTILGAGSPPTVAVLGGGIILSSATPGAAIFYTLDGTAPIPRNPAAVLYTAPFSAASGATLRARAWLAGFTASPELKATLPLS